MTMTGKRWLFYATNGYGLGHITRTMALARQIKKRDASAEILILTDSEAANLVWREGFACVKIIAFHSMLDGRIDRHTALALNRAMVATTFAGFRPQVMVVDGPPTGRQGELRGILPNDAYCVQIMREVRDDLLKTPGYIAALSRYDHVILAHRPGEVDLDLPEALRVDPVGYFMIRDPEERLPRAEARRRLGLPEEGFVLFVGFGGGGDRMTRRFHQAVFQEAQRFPDWTLFCPMPPFLKEELPPAPGVRVVRGGYYPLVEVMSAFDAAVSSLGDNTMAELFSAGLPSLFLPRVGMDDDQAARARRVEESGAGWILDPKKSFAALFDRLADPEARERAKQAASAFVQGNGAGRAAELLLALDPAKTD